MSSTQPPLEYLATASQSCLQDFESARLNQISKLRKEFSEVFEEWVEAEIAARLARWILEGRRAQDDAHPAGEIAAVCLRSSAVPPGIGEARQLSLPDHDSQPNAAWDSKILSPRQPSNCGSAERLAHPRFDPSNSPGLESRPASCGSSISAEASAALELLEQSAVCGAHLIRDCNNPAYEGHQESGQRAPMLPFPEARQSVPPPIVAARACPVSSHERTSGDRRTAARDKILSLPPSRSNATTCIAQIPQRSARAAKCGVSPTHSMRNVLRPFPPVRAPQRQVPLYRNVVLSRP